MHSVEFILSLRHTVATYPSIHPVLYIPYVYYLHHTSPALHYMQICIDICLSWNRSASLVLAYLVSRKPTDGDKMTLKSAWHEVKSRRPVVRPNSRFSQALLSWECEVQGQNSMTIEELCPKRQRKRNVTRHTKAALDRFNDSDGSGTRGLCAIL